MKQTKTPINKGSAKKVSNNVNIFSKKVLTNSMNKNTMYASRKT